LRIYLAFAIVGRLVNNPSTHFTSLKDITGGEETAVMWWATFPAFMIVPSASPSPGTAAGQMQFQSYGLCREYKRIRLNSSAIPEKRECFANCGWQLKLVAKELKQSAGDTDSIREKNKLGKKEVKKAHIGAMHGRKLAFAFAVKVWKIYTTQTIDERNLRIK